MDEVGAKRATRGTRGRVFRDADVGREHPRIHIGLVIPAVEGEQVDGARRPAPLGERARQGAGVGSGAIHSRAGRHRNEQEGPAARHLLHRPAVRAEIGGLQTDGRRHRVQTVQRRTEHGCGLRHPCEPESPVLPVEIDRDRTDTFPEHR